jgi:hypothetical protein
MEGSLGATVRGAVEVVISTSMSVAANPDFNGDGIPGLGNANPTTGLLQVWFTAASQGGTNGAILSSFTVTNSNPWRVKAAAINGSPISSGSVPVASSSIG